MKFDAEQFLSDFSIQHWTTGKNVTQGWVNIACPFCDDHSNHGGFDPVNGYYNCWKCGWHPLEEVVLAITGLSLTETRRELRKYSDTPELKVKGKEQEQPTTIAFPEGSEGRVNATAKNYLYLRGFDPDKIEKEYHLQSTKHLGAYKFRIIAPIFFEGEMVSYQGRDYTNKQVKYKACLLSKEIVHHKHTLYEIDRADRERGCVVVEGITDAWKLGRGAVSTFGIKFTTRQTNLLTGFKRVFILFDPEEEAQAMADRLAWQVQSLGPEVKVLEIDEGDPGSLSESDAKNLMKEVLG